MSLSSEELAKEVEAFLSSSTYDLNIFLQYLKSFVLSGSEPDSKLLLPILLHALARFTTSDFIACMSLVPPQMHDNREIEREIFALNDLENLLCTGEFGNFWELWSKEHKKDFLSRGCNTAAFEKEVRTHIVSVIATTTITITTADASKYLNATSPTEAMEFVTTAAAALGPDGGVKVVSCDEGCIVFEKNVFNNPESDIKQQAVTFADIAKIVA